MSERCILTRAALAAALLLAMPAAFAATAPAVNAKVNAGALQASGRYDRFIVTYRAGSTERASRSAVVQGIGAAIGRAGMNRTTLGANGKPAAALGVNYQRKLAIGADLVRTSRKLSAAEASTLMRQIAADPAVARVEPDAMMHAVRDIQAPATLKPAALLTGAPNDPYYAKYQWHFNNPSGGADVEKAWQVADGDGVTVAVLDTGITQHEDLDLSLADAGYDFITDAFISGRDADGRVAGGWDTGSWTTEEPWKSECTDASNPPEPSNWHGTHVAGNIAELTDNGVGMAGVAHAARILPVRVLGHCGGMTSDIADAIVWASGGHVDGVPDNQHPAQVINMSLGGGGACSADDVTGQAIAGAIARGTTVVVAAGNSNADAANFTPASCPGAITVGSNGITGKRAYYSNYGSAVTIAAPGGGVYKNDASSGEVANPEGFSWSTVNDGETVPTTADYGGMAGTSQATPHVAGTVALILGAARDAGLDTPTPAQIKTILTTTARPFPVTIDKPIGVGIVDALAAVDNVLGVEPPAETVTALTNGQLLGGQTGGTGATALYSIAVPAGARNLSLRTIGGSGDVTIFVATGAAPALDGSGAQYKSAKPGNNEAVVIARPQAATYYVRVVGVAAYAGVSVLANYQL
ncbi:protease [Frateuria sp. Soil773]|uniref:S8 family peptidase n=1 Tax=Frateuria sp. Soil773 TaxID=1736407 RepID=UPI0006FF95B1|nr:S8 family peptidase [Frateuria sp. Soil773]KRF00371.1 protease [Frateuria sp. Soil773]